MPATPTQTLTDASSCFTCLGMSVGDALGLALWDSISESAGPVADFVQRAGITDATQIAALQTLFSNAVLHGWWDKCDLIYPFVGGTALAHSQNLKSTSFTITWAGTVTHNANGITGNGTDAFGNANYIPSSSGQIALNSVHAGMYRRTAGALARRYFGSQTVAGVITVQQGAAGVARLIANDLTLGDAAGTALAFLVGARNDAANKHVFSGATDTTLVIASTGIPTVSVYVLANNNNGTTGSFTAANLAGFTMGSGVSFAEYIVMAADWQVFNTTLARQV